MLLLMLVTYRTNLICIILVSLQLVLLSSLPRFLHFFCSQKRLLQAVLKNLISNNVNSFLKVTVHKK